MWCERFKARLRKARRAVQVRWQKHLDDVKSVSWSQQWWRLLHLCTYQILHQLSFRTTEAVVCSASFNRWVFNYFFCQSTVGASDWQHATLSLPRKNIQQQNTPGVFPSKLTRETPFFWSNRTASPAPDERNPIVAKACNVLDTLSPIHGLEMFQPMVNVFFVDKPRQIPNKNDLP